MPDFPTFKYHPDPIATGSIVASDNICKCCEKSRGYIYSASVYAGADLDYAICPWCIADGSAAEKFAAEFTDAASIGELEDADEVSEAVIIEVSQRTPGFSAYQQEKWWTHCGDAAAFLGPMGWEELKAWGQDAQDAIWNGTEDKPNMNQSRFLATLDRDSGPTAYLFRCLVCGKFGGYADWA